MPDTSSSDPSADDAWITLNPSFWNPMRELWPMKHPAKSSGSNVDLAHLKRIEMGVVRARREVTHRRSEVIQIFLDTTRLYLRWRNFKLEVGVHTLLRPDGPTDVQIRLASASRGSEPTIRINMKEYVGKELIYHAYQMKDYRPGRHNTFEEEFVLK